MFWLVLIDPSRELTSNCVISFIIKLHLIFPISIVPSMWHALTISVRWPDPLIHVILSNLLI
jgi:hypothetical protein